MEVAVEERSQRGDGVDSCFPQEKEDSCFPQEKEDSCFPQDMLTGDEILSEEERSRRKAERRRAKKREPEWDVSSAFVANAASHIRPKGSKGRTQPSYRENKENEGRNCQVDSSDPKKRKGASLTEQGIGLFEQGQYTQAVDMFTAAILCDPKDHRFFGNRSYCYWCLESYPLALSDAQKSIQLAPDWPKGYFRKGSALMGLKRYEEAERAMEQVLKLDKDCGEATSELFNCRVLQLMELGFEEVQSILLLEKFQTVQAALASPEAVKGRKGPAAWGLICYSSSRSPCPSLWVGNVTVDLTEKHLWDLFKTCGEIESMRVLHERYCAFVNFKNAAMAAKALERLQGVELESTRLVIRYPDRWMQRTPPSLQSASGPQSGPANTGPRQMAPINGNECYFWRTTGCLYGDKCRFKHIPDQRRKDKKPWQP
ncbi:uncharacterized protein FYW47_004694 [Aplochiton taeniatus]